MATLATSLPGGVEPTPVETFPEKCRRTMRFKHVRYRTEQTYLPVMERFFAFHRHQ